MGKGIAVHGRIRYAKDMERLLRVLKQVESTFDEVLLSPSLGQSLQKGNRLEGRDLMEEDGLLNGEFEMLVSIGGDGTILEAARMVGRSGVPILGINNGRLGFLSSTPIEETEATLDRVQCGDFFVEQRSLVRVMSADGQFGTDDFALNEIAVHKSNRSSMIVVNAMLDGSFLNTYWADGLLISTPTGSTGYSLSAGGPIVSPNSKSLIITPIAPHNLNVRPLMVPDHHTITLKVEGPERGHLLSLDSTSYPLKPDTVLEISKADFTVGLVRFSQEDYLNTLRNKLMWGIDSRN